MVKIKIAKYAIAAYSLLFGAVGMIGPISYGPEALVYALQSLIIALGAVLLIPVSMKAMKVMMMASLAVYGLMVLTGSIVLFIIPLAGLLVFAIIAIPFVLSVLSLVWLHKEKGIQ